MAGTSISVAGGSHSGDGDETPAVGFALGIKSSFLYRAYSRMKVAIHMETEIDAKVAAKNAFCSMGQHCSSEVCQQRLLIGPLQQVAWDSASSPHSSLMCQAADCSPCQQYPGSGSQDFVCSQQV